MLHQVFLAVEVDHEIREILQFRVIRQLAQDWCLRLAGRAPRRVNGDQDRPPGFLRLGKGLGIEGLRACGECR
jgi:hypothetical protein